MTLRVVLQVLLTIQVKLAHLCLSIAYLYPIFQTHYYLALGYTALHLAIVKFRNDCAKLLIAELGVKGVGTINESGITAAHVAASSGVFVNVMKFSPP